MVFCLFFMQTKPNVATKVILARVPEVSKLQTNKANLPNRPLPALPPDFYPWANQRHQEFLEFWPATHVGGCLFVIGHAIGEIRNGLIIANLTLDFEAHLGVDGNRQRDSIPPRMIGALNRWNKALQIIETTQANSEVVTLLKTLVDGLEIQINTSLTLMSLEKGKSKCLALHHKILQILGSAEMEIQQLLQ